MHLIPVLCILCLCVAGAACTGQQLQEVDPAPAATTPPSPDGDADPAASPSPAWVADGVISDGEYAHSLLVSPGYMVHWNTDADLLTMGLEAQAEGWVAVGFEPTTRMNEADIVQGWVEDGEATVQDQFSLGPTGPHPPDTDLGGTDDLLERVGSEQNGTTVIEFSRRLDTGDAPYDKVFTPGQTVSIIWALSSSDDPTPMHDAGWGSAEITLAAA
ncbi:MAG: DOMON domain-containing protein [Methanomicrobiaceae archaeon]|nr:DOMON domain-containing protein [Methanomicrobiaceae archaeon]